MKHTQRLLVEEGDITAVANCQRPPMVVARDTVDGAVERIRPNLMIRSILFEGPLSLVYHGYEIESHLITFTDMDGEYRPAGESANQGHRKGDVP